MSEQMAHAINATNLADILERVLDKGIVIAGDIKIQIADVDLLTIKIRLVICSVDKALEMGINWWQQDSCLSTMHGRMPYQRSLAGKRPKAKKTGMGKAPV